MRNRQTERDREGEEKEREKKVKHTHTHAKLARNERLSKLSTDHRLIMITSYDCPLTPHYAMQFIIWSM